MQFRGLHAVSTKSGPRFLEECAEAIAEIRLGRCSRCREEMAVPAFGELHLRAER